MATQNEDEKEDPKLILILKETWNNPIGKFGIIALAGLGGVAFSGLILRVAAYALNGYKDFKEAAKR